MQKVSVLKKGKTIMMLLVFFGILFLFTEENFKERNVEHVAFSYLEETGSNAGGKEKLIPKTRQVEETTGRAVDEEEKKSSGEEFTGEIDCLLEIPQIDISRVVLTGGDREEKLANHFFVTGKDNMQYGDGSYVIFGHQSFTRNRGFNRLEELEVGDKLYIVGKGFRDIYQVTEIIQEQWGEAMEDFSEDTGQLAIYTCKKQRERPKPYFVVRARKAS